MLAQFLIRKNATGEVRNYSADACWGGDIGDFYYAEGNGACDCQRAQWFAKAGGETPLDFYKCSDELFDIEIRDGDVVLYSEFDD